LRNSGKVCFGIFYLKFFGWLGYPFVPSLKESTGNVCVRGCVRVCVFSAEAVIYVIHFESVYWRVNCHPLLLLVVCVPVMVSLYMHRYIQITWCLRSLTLHTTAVSTVQPLLGSLWDGQAMLYLFQKHLLCWDQEYIVCCNEITYIKVKFYVLY
jgi:hypothetical protein